MKDDVSLLTNPLSTHFLSAQPSCIEFSSLLSSIFVIGTYQLDESSEFAAGAEAAPPAQSRSGSIEIFRLEDDDTISLLQSLSAPSGILDLHFNPSRPEILAAATSTGSIALYRLPIPPPSISHGSNKSSSPRPFLSPGKVFSPFPTSTLVLCLSWNPSTDPNLRNEAATGLSDGSVAILDLGLSFQVKTLTKAHDDAVWAVNWSQGKEFTFSSSNHEAIIQATLQKAATASHPALLLPPDPQTANASQPNSVRSDKGTTIIGAGHFLFTASDDLRIRSYDIGCGCIPASASYFNPSTSLPSRKHPAPASTPSTSDTPTEDHDHESQPEEALHSIDLQASRTQPTALARFDDRTHGAGVTAVVPLPMREEDEEEVVLTGSYDECLRVLVPGLGRRWGCKAEKKLGGGVWRVEVLGWRDERNVAAEGEGDSGSRTSRGTRYLALASCMHAGARVVEVRCDEEQKWEIQVLARFEEHESMCYASAAVREAGGDGVRTGEDGKEGAQKWRFVSTSFYDRRACVWTFLWE